MRPSNERELAIARIVDKIATEGGLNLTPIEEVIAALGWSVIHGSDSAYLERYIQWRMETPMLKVEDPSSKRVDRNGTRIRIVDDSTGREVWNGKTDSNPGEVIRYSEDGIKKTVSVNGSTDVELLQALEHLLNPT